MFDLFTPNEWVAVNAIAFILLTCALVLATIFIGWRQYRLQKKIVRVGLHEKYLKLYEVIQGAINCLNKFDVDVLNIAIDIDVCERLEGKYLDVSSELHDILPTASALLKKDDYAQVERFYNTFQNFRVDLMYIRIALTTLSEDQRNDIAGDIGEISKYDFDAFYQRLMGATKMDHCIKTIQANKVEFDKFKNSQFIDTLKKVANISDVVF